MFIYLYNKDTIYIYVIYIFITFRLHLHYRNILYIVSNSKNLNLDISKITNNTDKNSIFSSNDKLPIVEFIILK